MSHWLVMLIMQVLGELDGDVDAAIEYMIAQRYAVGPDNVNGDPYMDYVCNGKP
jgi:OTU domain-containing protein 3